MKKLLLIVLAVVACGKEEKQTVMKEPYCPEMKTGSFRGCWVCTEDKNLIVFPLKGWVVTSRDSGNPIAKGSYIETAQKEISLTKKDGGVFGSFTYESEDRSFLKIDDAQITCRRTSN